MVVIWHILVIYEKGGAFGGVLMSSRAAGRVGHWAALPFPISSSYSVLCQDCLSRGEERDGMSSSGSSLPVLRRAPRTPSGPSSRLLSPDGDPEGPGQNWLLDGESGFLF